MAKQEQKQRTATEKKEGQKSAGVNPATVKEGKKTIEETDALLDKIDDVLEENAEEFVKNYVQKSGE